MWRCWTCGSKKSGFRFKCGDCTNHPLLEKIEQNVSSFGSNADARHESIERALRNNFSELSNAISARLSNIASVIEWGLQGLSWQVEQQTDVLRSIDQTLKTPVATRANELRQQAEEAKQRGALRDAEELYVEALNSYRLDYRIYIGLAETYLQKEEVEKAEHILERSQPHAPKGDIDYKSYSLRLMGHIQACRENFRTAVILLREAISLSPTYVEAYYDHAQYCAQLGDSQNCLQSLQQAISLQPLYWLLTLNERNFDPIRFVIDQFLHRMAEEPSRLAYERLNELIAVYRLVPEVWSQREDYQKTKFESSLSDLSKLITLNTLSTYKDVLREVQRLAGELEMQLLRNRDSWSKERRGLALRAREFDGRRMFVNDRNQGGLGCLPLLAFVLISIVLGGEVAIVSAFLIAIILLVENFRHSSRELEEINARLQKADTAIAYFDKPLTQLAQLKDINE